MSLFSFLGLGFSAIAANAQKAQGEAALAASKRQAYDIETEMEVQAAQALAKDNVRHDEYKLSMSSNMALFSAFGNVNSASWKAAVDREKQVLSNDLYAIATQGEIDIYRTKSERRIALEEGYARKTAANIGAFTTMATGIMNFADTYSKAGKGTG